MLLIGKEIRDLLSKNEHSMIYRLRINFRKLLIHIILTRLRAESFKYLILCELKSIKHGFE